MSFRKDIFSLFLILEIGDQYMQWCSSTSKVFTAQQTALEWLIFLREERRNENHADVENAPGLRWGKYHLKKKHLLMTFKDCSVEKSSYI